MKASDMPARNFRRYDYADRDALASALAALVAGKLSAAVNGRGAATLAVSGGSTPAKFFAALSERDDVDWGNVTVVPVDERFVDESSSRSNAGLVKSKLLVNAAARARFVSLFSPDMDIERAAALADDRIGRLGLPLDAAILGMGNDGHTASFFPDARDLDQLLNQETLRIVAPVHAASAGEPRLTLTLPVIEAGRLVVLHIEGAEKALTLEKALAAGSTLPIRRVIDAARTPVEIFWAA